MQSHRQVCFGFETLTRVTALRLARSRASLGVGRVRAPLEAVAPVASRQQASIPEQTHALRLTRAGVHTFLFLVWRIFASTYFLSFDAFSCAMLASLPFLAFTSLVNFSP